MPGTAVLRKLKLRPLEKKPLAPKKLDFREQFFTFQDRIGVFRTVRIDPRAQPKLFGRLLRLKDLQTRFNNSIGIRQLRKRLSTGSSPENKRIIFSEIRNMQKTRPLNPNEINEYRFLLNLFTQSSLESQQAHKAKLQQKREMK